MPNGDGYSKGSAAEQEPRESVRSTRGEQPWPLLFSCPDACDHRAHTAACSCPVIQTLEALLDSIPDGLLLLSRDHEVVWANAAAVGNRERSRAIGRPCHEVCLGSPSPCGGCPVEECYATGKPAVAHAVNPEGTTWELRAVPLSCPDGTLRGVVKIMRDVTARLEAERARESLLQELAAKNKELERFADTVAHDLKSPVVGLLAVARLLGEDLRQDGSQADHYLSMIAGAGREMLELINRLLEVSRAGKPVGVLGNVPLADVLRDALRDLGGFLAEGDAQVAFADWLPSVKGDRLRLRQVFTNLLANAAKFAKPGARPQIEVLARRDGDVVECAVKDQGVGIEPRFLPRMFDVLEKCGSPLEGSGLGLAIVKRIVEAHGGRIWAESEGPGTGCTVFFTLPAKGPRE